jgi:hypothetical protein
LLDRFIWALPLGTIQEHLSSFVTRYHALVVTIDGRKDDGIREVVPVSPYDSEIEPDEVIGSGSGGHQYAGLVASHSNHWTDLITEQAIVFFATLPFYFLLLHTPSFLLSLPVQMGLCFLVMFLLELGSLVFIIIHNRVVEDPKNIKLFQTEADVKNYASYLKQWYWRIAVATVLAGVISSAGFYFFASQTGSWTALASFLAGHVFGIGVHGINWMFKSLWWKGALRASSSDSDTSDDEDLEEFEIELPDANLLLDVSKNAVQFLELISSGNPSLEKGRLQLLEGLKMSSAEQVNLFVFPENIPLVMWVFENVFKQETGLLISDAVFIYESAAEVLFSDIPLPE